MQGLRLRRPEAPPADRAMPARSAQVVGSFEIHEMAYQPPNFPPDPPWFLGGCLALFLLEVAVYAALAFAIARDASR